MYQGCFVEGTPRGHGVMEFVSGATYSGEWEQGSMHGWGHHQDPDGSSYSGTFGWGLREGDGVVGGNGSSLLW